MARLRRNTEIMTLGSAVAKVPGLFGWAESVGEALGRGVARGINTGLTAGGTPANGLELAPPPRRGRPPKVQSNEMVPPDRICQVEGCGRIWRSKGLCSAHYQAARRRMLAQQA